MTDQCDGCGIEVVNELNLTSVEVNGEAEEWCPGCIGASGNE